METLIAGKLSALRGLNVDNPTCPRLACGLVEHRYHTFWLYFWMEKLLPEMEII